ncbi:Taurine catabolism dioxygenase TauD, TfdA family [compost metagenome]
MHFGDGTPIPAEWIEVILNTSQALAVAFPWCVGDLLVIDNLRMAHARRPYDGMRHHHSMLGDLCN